MSSVNAKFWKNTGPKFLSASVERRELYIAACFHRCLYSAKLGGWCALEPRSCNSTPWLRNILLIDWGLQTNLREDLSEGPLIREHVNSCCLSLVSKISLFSPKSVLTQNIHTPWVNWFYRVRAPYLARRRVYCVVHGRFVRLWPSDVRYIVHMTDCITMSYWSSYRLLQGPRVFTWQDKRALLERTKYLHCTRSIWLQCNALILLCSSVQPALLQERVCVNNRDRSSK